MAKATAASPNLYELSGDRVAVTYSTTSIDGKPRFSYRKGRQTLDFAGSDIKSESTGIGTLVSVVIASVPDKGTTSFSLLLPAIQLGDSKRVSLRTIGIETLAKTSIAGPPPGVQQTYKAVGLRGSAKLVQF